MTPNEIENIATIAAMKVADRLVTELRAERQQAIAYHAATCDVKKRVDDAESQAKGRKAVWVLVFTGAGLAGSIVGPFLKDAVAGIFK